MQLPSPLRPGDSLSAWSSRVIDYLRSITPQSSTDLRINSGCGGTTFELNLPRGGGGSEATHPFQGYKSSYTGTGTPPADQARRIRIRPGTVSQLVPSNIDAEFTCTASATTYFWVKAIFSTARPSAYVTAATIEQGTAIPAPQEVEDDSAPTEGYKGILRVVCSGTGITEIQQLTMTSINTAFIVCDYGCGTVTKDIQWT